MPPPGSATIRRPRHSCPSAFAIASSEGPARSAVHISGRSETRARRRAAARKIRGEAASLRIDGMPGLKGFRQRWRCQRLDADDLDAPGIQSGDTSDQPAAADRYEDGVDVGRLLLEFEAERPLTQDGFRSWSNAGIGIAPVRCAHCLAGRKRIGVAVALDSEGRRRIRRMR